LATWQGIKKVLMREIYNLDKPSSHYCQKHISCLKVMAIWKKKKKGDVVKKIWISDFGF
jgi:hypothetical protein